MINVINTTKVIKNGIMTVKFEFEFDNSSSLPTQIYMIGHRTYVIAEGSTAKNLTTNNYYKYTDKDMWVKTVSPTKIKSNNEIVNNGNYSITNNDLTGFTDVNVSVFEDADVKFYDYDGTVVYAYTKEQFLKLNKFPENPKHDILIGQGWNWTFENAKSYVAKYGTVEIGQMYTTKDGATKLFILANANETVKFSIAFNEQSSIEVDWGDETEADIYEGDSTTTTLQHTYTEDGNYVISVKVVGGTISIVNFLSLSMQLRRLHIGAGITYMSATTNPEANVSFEVLECVTIPNTITSFEKETFGMCYILKCFVVPNSISVIPNTLLCNSFSLEHIILADTVTTIGDGAFCRTIIKTLIIPESVTHMGDSIFEDCYMLTNIIIPGTVEIMESYPFNNCSGLRSVIFGEGITEIPSECFANCCSLNSVVIPNTVTKIKDWSFYGCCSLITINIPNSVVEIEGEETFNNQGSMLCINIDNTENAISGAPWGAYNSHCRVNWLRS